MTVQKSRAERDNGIDNLKALLIICVVFGHILEEIRLDGFYGIIRSVIYSFHMPAFIFLSGYYAKNEKKTYDSAVTNCLIPFAIFNTLWLFLTAKTWWRYLLQPSYVYWFMLSLFFWRTLTPALSKIRGILPLSFALSLYIGLVGQADRFLSISRTISFFPFFLLGFFCPKESITQIRRIPHVLCVLLLCAIFFLTAWMNIKQWIPVKMYEFIQSYESCGISGKSGLLQRGVILLAALAIIVCLINLVTEQETFLCKTGRRTAAIYLLSSFVIYGAFYWIKKSMWMEIIEKQWTWGVFASAVLTAVVLLLCGNHCVQKGYHAAITKIGGFFHFSS